MPSLYKAVQPCAMGAISGVLRLGLAACSVHQLMADSGGPITCCTTYWAAFREPVFLAGQSSCVAAAAAQASS